MAQKGDNEKFCSECGQIINIKAEICPKCGVRQHAAPILSSLHSAVSNGSHGSSTKTTAGVLAILLGGIGAHKFYLGKPVHGVLYLVFCWSFIPAIIGFIEGLNFLTMSDQTFAARYSVGR